MRLVELPIGIPVFLSNVESKVYESMKEEICKEDLSERDAHIAQQLVGKGVCKRIQKEGKTYYCKTKGSIL